MRARGFGGWVDAWWVVGTVGRGLVPRGFGKK